MNDDQLLRYSRHILLDDVGIEGQQRWLDARALVIGAGGLGSPVALYLATAGIGSLTLVDGDTVELEVELGRMSSRAGKGHGRASVAGETACEADLLFVLVPADAAG